MARRRSPLTKRQQENGREWINRRQASYLDVLDKSAMATLTDGKNNPVELSKVRFESIRALLSFTMPTLTATEFVQRQPLDNKSEGELLAMLIGIADKLPPDALQKIHDVLGDKLPDEISKTPNQPIEQDITKH